MVSFTTDQGAEFKLGELPALDLQQVAHGFSLQLHHDGDGDGASDGGGVPDVDAKASHTFPYTLVVVGMLHIVYSGLHNDL